MKLIFLPILALTAGLSTATQLSIEKQPQEEAQNDLNQKTIKQALQTCIVEKCVTTYKSEECLTCHHNCTNNGNKFFACLYKKNGQCADVCKGKQNGTSPADKKNFQQCKARCVEAAKDDEDPLGELLEVEAIVDIDEEVPRENNKNGKRLARRTKWCVNKKCVKDLSEECQTCKTDKRNNCMKIKNKDDRGKCFKTNNCAETCFGSSDGVDDVSEIKSTFDSCKATCASKMAKRQRKAQKIHKKAKQINLEVFKTCMVDACFPNFYSEVCSQCKSECINETVFGEEDESEDEEAEEDSADQTEITKKGIMKPFKSLFHQCKEDNKCTRKECKVEGTKQERKTKRNGFKQCRKGCLQSARA